MNLSQLYYFRKLAQLEHYTKAAKELYITQPSLSDSIAALEGELGISLFQREGRNIKLTKDGEEFYHYVCSALNELETGITLAKEKAGGVGGVIDLGCIPTLLGDFLPQAVNGYIKTKNPKAKFNIYQGMSLSIIEGVKNGSYDIGFCSQVDNEPELVFIPVIAQELVAVVNDQHPLSEKKEIYIKDLKHYQLTTYRENIPIGKTVRTLLAKHGVSASFSYDDEISIGGVISANPWIAIAADTPFLKQFTNLIKIKLLDVPADTRLIHMVYSRKNYIPQAAQTFADYIVAKQMNLPEEACLKTKV